MDIVINCIILSPVKHLICNFYVPFFSARINDAAFDEEQGGDNIIFDDVDDDDEDIDDVSVFSC